MVIEIVLNYINKYLTKRYPLCKLFIQNTYFVFDLIIL